MKGNSGCHLHLGWSNCLCFDLFQLLQYLHDDALYGVTRIKRYTLKALTGLGMVQVDVLFK